MVRISGGSGKHADEILRDYPSLTPQDILASLHYAALLAKERHVALTPGDLNA